MKTDTVLVAKDIRLTFRTVAKSIYVSSHGEVTIVLERFGPEEPLPDITADYLDAICSRFYYGGYTHQDAIADILLLNGVLSHRDYDEFYSALKSNLCDGKITVIAFRPS